MVNKPDGPRGISLESLGLTTLPRDWPEDQSTWTPAMHAAYAEHARGTVAGIVGQLTRFQEQVDAAARANAARRAAWEAAAPVRNARRRELLRELVHIDHGGHLEGLEPGDTLEDLVRALEGLDFFTLGCDEYRHRQECEE